MGRKSNVETDVFKFVDMRGGDQKLCWPWTGAMSGTDQDRPTFSIGGKKVLAYRLIYKLVHGKDPEHLQVRHTCDNSVCCNPYHMELGTHRENNLDNVQRDRTGLPVQAVRKIKALLSENKLKSGEIARLVSAEFSVPCAASTVRSINAGNRRTTQEWTAEEVEAQRQRGEHVRHKSVCEDT